MPARPRRQQRRIAFASDRAFSRLQMLTRNGRSQVDVIEEALERMPLPAASIDRQALRAEIGAIVARGRNLPAKSLKEIDAEMYDANGMPR
jgi:hypothetical protein